MSPQSVHRGSLDGQIRDPLATVPSGRPGNFTAAAQERTASHRCRTSVVALCALTAPQARCRMGVIARRPIVGRLRVQSRVCRKLRATTRAKQPAIFTSFTRRSHWRGQAPPTHPRDEIAYAAGRAFRHAPVQPRCRRRTRSNPSASHGNGRKALSTMATPITSTEGRHAKTSSCPRPTTRYEIHGLVWIAALQPGRRGVGVLPGDRLRCLVEPRKELLARDIEQREFAND